MIEPLDRRGTWRTYSTADGLPGIRIEHIAEDREGFLWFATWDNGVSRFDGDEFLNFSELDGLVHHQVNAILNDGRNRLWFGTSGGACWYDGENFHPVNGEGIEGRTVGAVFEDSEGRIWFGGNHILGYYDDGVFHDMAPEIPPSSIPECCGITQDSQGCLWIGARYPIRYDGVSFHLYDETAGFPRAELCYSVSRDPEGNIWLGRLGCDDKVWRYTDGTFHSVDVDLGGWLRKIQCDREGRMWFCTLEGAVYQDGDGFSSFSLSDGLPHPAVHAVFQDCDHQFWFATWGGVGRYDDSIGIFELELGSTWSKCDVSQIAQDPRGGVWVGVTSPILHHLKKSVFRFNGDSFSYVSTVEGSDVNNCFTIHEDDSGNMWFGGINGLYRYNGKHLEKTRSTPDLSDHSVCQIARDACGRLIYGHWDNRENQERDGLFVSPLRLVIQTFQETHTVFKEKQNIRPFSRFGAVITGPDGDIYFCLSDTHFANANNGFARWHPEDGLRFYGIDDGLIDANINDLLLDHTGNLWAATGKGLCRFDGNAFQAFTSEDGLPSDYIRCIFEDRRGRLWIGTNNGVAQFDGRIFQRIRSRHIGPVCRIREDRDGTFWFGTVFGTVIRYRVRHVSPRVRLLQVIADQIYANFSEVVRTSYGQQVIFEYKGLGFSTHPRDMLYIYRLNGYDVDWQPPTRELRAQYRDLPPGDYTFQVRAIDRDLNDSEAAQVGLTITTDPRIEAFAAILKRRGGESLIGSSAALRHFKIDLRKIASADLTVLIMGETGTGKGLAARALHALSAHCDGPFIEVSCGALPTALIDSELFGHEKGAFTNAASHRLGRVELAEGGTLFLDEIGDMATETQGKLLRLLQEGTFERVGSSDVRKARTRIVAATNRNLEEMVAAGVFREDLYYRLNALPIHLPPLRERKDDIPELAEFFKERMASHLGKRIEPLTREVFEVLKACDWPGNVRELEHTIQRAVVLCAGPRIRVEDLGLFGSPGKGTTSEPEPSPVSGSRRHGILPLEESERRCIINALEATNWRIKGARGAAALLGLPPSTLYGKMKKLGIKDQMAKTV